MNKSGKQASTSDVPKQKFKRPTLQDRHIAKIIDQAEKEGVTPQYAFNKWMEAAEAVYDKKYSQNGSAAATS